MPQIFHKLRISSNSKKEKSPEALNFLGILVTGRVTELRAHPQKFIENTTFLRHGRTGFSLKIKEKLP